MKEILGEVARWRDAGIPSAIARVVDVEGSGPRAPGGQFSASQARVSARNSASSGVAPIAGEKKALEGLCSQTVSLSVANCGVCSTMGLGLGRRVA